MTVDENKILKIGSLQQKHDYEFRWNMTEDFVPAKGEIIVYDAEVDGAGEFMEGAETPAGRDLTSAYRSPRFKIGDGKTDVKDLDFVSIGAESTGRSSEKFNFMGNVASGNYSHAEGYKTTASGISSHAEGQGSNNIPNTVTTESSNDDILNEWDTTKFSLAKGIGSHVEGVDCLALGTAAHAEGYACIALGNCSHASGSNTQATAGNEFVIGKYNLVEDNDRNVAFVIGNGNAAKKSNAVKITNEGNATFAGTIQVNNNKEVATKEYVDNSIAALDVEAITGDDDVTFIQSVSEADGKIRATKQTIRTATTGQTGIVQLDDNVSTFSDTAATPRAVNNGVALANQYTNECIEALQYNGPDTSDSYGTAFISAVAQSNGVITATKIKVQEGTTSKKGIVKLYNGVDSDSTALAATANAVREAYDTACSNHYITTGRKEETTEGQYSTAEGHNTTASASCSHAEGHTTSAEGTASHTEGHLTRASDSYAHAEGYGTTATGVGSHAEGGSTLSSNDEGFTTTWTTNKNYSKAGGAYSHVEGSNCYAKGERAHAEGLQTYAKSNNSHAEGELTTAFGLASHAEGNKTTAYGEDSHAEGNKTTAYGDRSHAEGRSGTVASTTLASNGIALNADTTASDIYEVWKKGNKYNFTLAFGVGSHVEGNDNIAFGRDSHAEGGATFAEGPFAHAEGSTTIAKGHAAHAEGAGTKAIGYYSHAEGWGTTASGDYSHSSGYNTTAKGHYQTVIGKYNNEDDNKAFIIGKGSAESPSNAMTVNWSGDAWFAGGGEFSTNLTVTGETATDTPLRLISSSANGCFAKFTYPNGETTFDGYLGYKNGKPHVYHNSTDYKIITTQELSSALDNDSTTTAATPNAVKQLKIIIDELDYSDPTPNLVNKSLCFISEISQTNGQISATKKYITHANNKGTYGITTLSDDYASDIDKANETDKKVAATAYAVKSAYQAAIDALDYATEIDNEGPTCVKVNSGSYKLIFNEATNTLTLEEYES